MIDAPLQPELDAGHPHRLRASSAPRTAAATSRSPCAPRPPPKTCPTPASPASRKPSSTSPAPTTSCARSRKSSPRLYNDRAIAYRVHHGFKHEDVFLSAGVQLMVRSDVGASGVLFTLDTESGFRDVVFITSSYGLGENVVQGAVNPGRVLRLQADAAAGQAGDPAPLARRQADPHGVFGRSPASACATRTRRPSCATRFSISDADVHELARQALIIEQHYGRPMDIEWAKDGVSGKLFIVQARPETVKSRGHADADRALPRSASAATVRGRRPRDRPEDRRRRRARGALARRHEPRAARRRAGRRHDRSRLGAGDEARRGHRHQPRRPHLPRGDHRARTRRAGGRRHRQRARHASRTARKSPSAAPKATPASSTTAPCPSSAPPPTWRNMPPAPLKIMMNVANPERAFDFAQLPQRRHRPGAPGDDHRQPHRRASQGAAGIRRSRTRRRSRRSTRRSPAMPSPVDFYVDRLAEGIATITASVAPHPVIVRLSDFKSNEYANLIGGTQLRAARRKPDDRLPRRQPLRRSELRRVLRAGMPGGAQGARRDGPDQLLGDDPVRAHAGRRPQGASRCCEATA